MNFHLGMSKCFGILLSGTYKVELIRSFSEKSSSKIKEAVTRASIFEVDSNEQLRKYFSNKSRDAKLRQESSFRSERGACFVGFAADANHFMLQVRKFNV